jgi:hypothetical protein
MVGEEAETAVGAEGRGATGFGDVVGAVQAVQVHRGAQAGENLGRGAGAYSGARSEHKADPRLWPRCATPDSASFA